MGHEYVKEGETFNTSRNGTVPKPTAGDITNNKVLRADGSWVQQSGGGGSSHTYSTTEQVVGTWIDNKPVYEKTVEFGAIAAGTNNYQIDLGLTTVNKVIDICCIAYNSGTVFFRLPLALLTSALTSDYGVAQQGFDKSTGKLRIDLGAQRSLAGGYVIIRYTKTTD